MTTFYIPTPTQYINLTTTSLTIKKQQIKVYEPKVIVNGLLIARFGL